MRDYVIVSDSTCDLSVETRKELGIDIIDIYVFVDGKEMPCSIDWGKYYTADEYYDWLKSGKKISTSQASPNDFITFFENRLKQGKDVLYIGCSSAMSATVNSAKIARDDIQSKYPEARIIIIDSLRASLGLGLMVVKAAELKKLGKTLDEVVNYTEEHRNNVQQVGTVNTLMYLKRAGRIKGFAAVMGTLASVKPLIIADAKGMNASIGKSIGNRKAYKRCVEYVKSTILDSENQYIYLAHTNYFEVANKIKEMLLAEIPCKGVIMEIVNPSMANSVGPEMFGIYYYGKKVEYVAE